MAKTAGAVEQSDQRPISAADAQALAIKRAKEGVPQPKLTGKKLAELLRAREEAAKGQ